MLAWNWNWNWNRHSIRHAQFNLRTLRTNPFFFLFKMLKELKLWRPRVFLNRYRRRRSLNRRNLINYISIQSQLRYFSLHPLLLFRLFHTTIMLPHLKSFLWYPLNHFFPQPQPLVKNFIYRSSLRLLNTRNAVSDIPGSKLVMQLGLKTFGL